MGPVFYTLIFKNVIEDITCQKNPEVSDKDKEMCPSAEDSYRMIFLFVFVHALTQVISVIRQIPFAYICGQVETEIAVKVYMHIQN